LTNQIKPEYVVLFKVFWQWRRIPWYIFFIIQHLMMYINNTLKYISKD